MSLPWWGREEMEIVWRRHMVSRKDNKHARLEGVYRLGLTLNTLLL